VVDLESASGKSAAAGGQEREKRKGKREKEASVGVRQVPKNAIIASNGQKTILEIHNKAKKGNSGGEKKGEKRISDRFGNDVVGGAGFKLLAALSRRSWIREETGKKKGKEGYRRNEHGGIIFIDAVPR